MAGATWWVFAEDVATDEFLVVQTDNPQQAPRLEVPQLTDANDVRTEVSFLGGHGMRVVKLEGVQMRRGLAVNMLYAMGDSRAGGGAFRTAMLNEQGAGARWAAGRSVFSDNNLARLKLENPPLHSAILWLGHYRQQLHEKQLQQARGSLAAQRPELYNRLNQTLSAHSRAQDFAHGVLESMQLAAHAARVYAARPQGQEWQIAMRPQPSPSPQQPARVYESWVYAHDLSTGKALAVRRAADGALELPRLNSGSVVESVVGMLRHLIMARHDSAAAQERIKSVTLQQDGSRIILAETELNEHDKRIVQGYVRPRQPGATLEWVPSLDISKPENRSKLQDPSMQAAVQWIYFDRHPTRNAPRSIRRNFDPAVAAWNANAAPLPWRG